MTEQLGPVLNYPAPDGETLSVIPPGGRPVTVPQLGLTVEAFREIPLRGRAIWQVEDLSHRVRIWLTAPQGPRVVFLVDDKIDSPNDAVSGRAQ